jgi:hypothetical protein
MRSSSYAEPGVTVLAYCRSDPQTRNVIAVAPEGLYAELAKGNVPDWLEPVPATRVSTAAAVPGHALMASEDRFVRAASPVSLDAASGYSVGR